MLTLTMVHRAFGNGHGGEDRPQRRMPKKNQRVQGERKESKSMTSSHIAMMPVHPVRAVLRAIDLSIKRS